MKRFLLPVLMLLAACGGDEPTRQEKIVKDIPVYDYGDARGPGSLGTHLVASGDTFDSIASRYGVTKPDLLAANNLKGGDQVKMGTRLLLPRPRDYKAREGDTVRTVANMFEVQPGDLAKLNKLDGPYLLTPGQTINLPRQRLNNLVQQVMAKPFVPPQPKPKPLFDAPLTQAQAANRDHVLKLPDHLRQQELARLEAQQQQQAVLTPPQPQPIAPDTRQSIDVKPTEVAAVTSAPPRPVPAGKGLMAPVVGKVVAKYGNQADGRQNDGINIAAPSGTPVQAADRGRVVFAGDDIPGYGNMILVQHDKKLVTVYAHLGRVMVRKGDTVEKGDMLGTVGQTGAVTSPQLHFEVRDGKTTKNPASVIRL
jgi:murein DD-endopeptidase MepM/ murein hydrolase activator NlpD